MAALLSTCLATALVAAGCGSSSAAGGLDPIAQAATASTSRAGYELNLTMQMTSPALPSAITASGSGSFDVPERAGQFNLAMTLPNTPQITQALGSNTMSLQEVIDGTTVYVRMPAAIAQKLPGGKPWIKVDLAKEGAAMGMTGLSSLSSPLSTDPSQLLQYLRSISGGVTKVGTGTVAGYPTTEYKAQIDLTKVADKVPTTNRAAVQQSIRQLENLTHLSTLPVEVWIDNDHLVRRLDLQMSLNTNGVALAMSMQLTIPVYGPQPRPATPPASQVNDVSSLQSAASSSSAAGS